MIYRRGKKGTYWMRFGFDGRIVHESTRTKTRTLAKDAEVERRRQLELSYNGVTKRRGLPPTFERASEAWLKSRADLVASNTQTLGRTALKHLVSEFGPKLLCDITPASIQEYQQRRVASKAQGRTINIEVGALRQILKMHECWKPLEGKVKMLRERKDLGRALSPEEERSLLEATSAADSACYTATVLALNTAMRRNEIRMLCWSQVDWSKHTVRVGVSKTAAGTGRLIPLNSPALDALVKWAGRFPNASDEHYVFPWCENRQLDAARPTKGWRTAWRHALKRAGFHCRFHDLRVTCITKMAEALTPDLVIMSVAGHVSRAMLEHYSRIRTDAKRRALDNIARPAGAEMAHAQNQNRNQIQTTDSAPDAKLLN